MRKATVAALALATWLSITPAGARSAEPAQYITTPGRPVAPKLAGDRILWTAYPRRRGVELWSAVAGERPQRIRAFGDGLGGELATSSSRTLFTTFDQLPGNCQGCRGPSEVKRYLGWPHGAFAEVDECTEHAPGMRSSDVWRDAYVYRRCDGEERRVAIRDLAPDPLSPARDVGVSAVGARIAGRFVAWLETDAGYNAFCCSAVPDIVVYDRVGDVEVYRLRSEELPGLIRSLDIQDDGKVAFSYVGPTRNGMRSELLAWASIAEPEVHTIHIGNAHLNDLRLARNRIAFQRGDNTYFDWVKDAEVGITDLAGNSKTIARNTDAWILSQSFDYDGERVVWRELRCETFRLTVRAVAGSRIEPGGPSRCPLRLLGAPKVTRRVVTLRPSCGPLPCEWQISLRTLDGRTRLGGGVTKDGVARIRLSRAGRRLLAGRRALRIRVRAEVGGSYAPEVRRTTVRLRLA